MHLNGIAWLELIISILLVLLGTGIGFFIRAFFQKKKSRVDITNKLIDKLEAILDEMRGHAFELIKSDESNLIEVTHHIFVAQNSRIKAVCNQLNDINPHFPAVQDKLLELKKSCDQIIEHQSEATVYGALISAQQELLHTYKYVISGYFK
ncbi:hypothetical protein V1358_03995 [Pseudoalteromonas sp. YIC-656]|uniref:hypothetical protein n=1 Tax=Pseudoalteromonas pernae TaxID=3118054 RepID=UPI003241C143